MKLKVEAAFEVTKWWGVLLKRVILIIIQYVEKTGTILPICGRSHTQDCGRSHMPSHGRNLILSDDMTRISNYGQSLMPNFDRNLMPSYSKNGMLSYSRGHILSYGRRNVLICEAIYTYSEQTPNERLRLLILWICRQYSKSEQSSSCLLVFHQMLVN